MEVEPTPSVNKPIDGANLEQAVLLVCRQHSSGVLQSTLVEELRGVPTQQLAAAINALLSAGKIKTARNKDSQLVFMETTNEDRTQREKLKGLNAEERFVYQIIQASGNRGIWQKDIKTKSNLQPSQITKILKTLEGRKLIKWVKSVTSKNRRLYMVMEVEPHLDITGDIWYAPNQEIDSEFIGILQKQCYQTIEEKKLLQNNTKLKEKFYVVFASAEDIRAAIRKSGVFKVEIRLENIQSILDTLIYDGKIEAIEDPRGPGFMEDATQVLYKPSNLETFANGFTSVPCAVCPVFDKCHDEGPITPVTCVYYNAWLEF